ncbi:MAG: hypothetical protein NTAFB01_25900 [Nitrospira sp.]
MLSTEGGYGDCFLNVCQTVNLRSDSFELKQSHLLLTEERLNKWSPDRLKVMEPPAWRRLPFRESHGGRRQNLTLCHWGTVQLMLMVRIRRSMQNKDLLFPRYVVHNFPAPPRAHIELF